MRCYLVATGEVAEGSFLRIRCLAPSRSPCACSTLETCLSLSFSHDRTLLLTNATRFVTTAAQYETATSQAKLSALPVKYSHRQTRTLCEWNYSVRSFWKQRDKNMCIVYGWSSNSNYSLLGGLRSVAETISYEVSLALILLSFVFLICGYNLSDFYYFLTWIWYNFTHYLSRKR
jgi:hypothetical protein